MFVVVGHVVECNDSVVWTELHWVKQEMFVWWIELIVEFPAMGREWVKWESHCCMAFVVCQA